MGRKKRPNPSTEYNNVSLGTNNQLNNTNDNLQKKSKNDKEESYPVKKYRSSTYYPSIEAFAKYTKAHRMLDASYVRTLIPNAPPDLEKPFLFSTRIGGQNLAFGRGKSRDAAIDCACRAAFSLVQAHGYEEFKLDDDCFISMPNVLTLAENDNAPPPPPPPLPPIGIGAIPPTGFPPGIVPPGAVQPASLIPQATSINEVPVASSLTSNVTETTFSIEKKPENVVTTKGGLRLVFIPDVVEDENKESCMEERRALQPRYQMMLHKAVLNRRIANASLKNDDII